MRRVCFRVFPSQALLCVGSFFGPNGEADDVFRSVRSKSSAGWQRTPQLLIVFALVGVTAPYDGLMRAGLFCTV